MSGKQTEEDILYEFLDTFEQAYAIKHGESKTRDKSVNMDEWLEYYNTISCSIDNDDYFELMMTNTWNLNGRPAPKKAWAGEMWKPKEVIPPNTKWKNEFKQLLKRT